MATRRCDRNANSPSLPAGSGLGAPPGDGDLARLGHLDEPERAHEALEGLDLVRLPDDLDDDRAPGDVDHPGLEDLRELQDLRPRRGVGGDLEDGELAGDRLLRLEVADL